MNKKKILKIASVLLVLVGASTLHAQDITTVTALNTTIGDNLDLEAVASVFGDSKNLEDFESRLNDPKLQLSNLDLNEDNTVDYLRVVETAENNTHLIAIQAVLSENTYQDVATIEVEKDADNKTQVQIVGDVYLYGSNYIIEPVYVYRPLIFSLFWRPFYHPYRSVFYWGYYPKHFHFWHPQHVYTYRKNVHVHINVNHTYTHTRVRRSTRAVHLHSTIKRNDVAKKHPNKSYTATVVGVNQSNGTKKRAYQVKKSNGDTFRIAGINKPNGTKKRIVGVNKADSTKKRAMKVQRPDGSRKVVTTKKKPTTTKHKAKVKKGYNNGKKGANNAKNKVSKRRKKRK